MVRKIAAEVGEANRRAQLVLERDAEDPGRDRADDDDPGEARVVVARRRPPPHRADEAMPDPLPVVEEEEEEDQRRRAVGGDQEGEEVVVVLVDVPAEQLRQQHRVAEAGDRERLRDPLQGPEDDRLQVRDRFQGSASLSGDRYRPGGWRTMNPSGLSTGEVCQRGPGPPTVSKARPPMIIQACSALA